MKELGLIYHTDYMNDEQPYLIHTRHGPLVSIPYTQEVNDIGMFLRRNFTATEAFEMLKDEFDELYRASEKSGRMMSVGLHPHIIGRAFRARALRQFLDYARGSTTSGGRPARRLPNGTSPRSAARHAGRLIGCSGASAGSG